MALEAVIFDMDGVLIDSEPLWRQAEVEVFRGLGVPITPARCRETTGLRVDDAVAHWAQRYPWSQPPRDEVARTLTDRVRELIGERGEAMSGATQAVQSIYDRGLKLALASSSPRQLIEAVLDRLGLTAMFEAAHSAELEPYGKPHPGIYLSTAALLGTSPTNCLAVEDSLNGVIAAKAARMSCVAVPALEERYEAHFAVADVVLESLSDIDHELNRMLDVAP